MVNRTAAYVGRPIPLHTKLGQIMIEHGLRAYIVAGQAGIASRTMTEYLAARKPISSQHLTSLCKLFDCDPEDLVD